MMVRRIPFISLVCACAWGMGVAQTREPVRSFYFRDVELRAALDSLVKWYAVPLVYLEKDVEGKRVTTDCRACTFEEALRGILAGKALFALMVGEQVLLQVRREESEPKPAIFAGTVEDSTSGEWLVGVSVVLRRTDTRQILRWGLTNEFGFFSLSNIEPGMYVLELRALGYVTRFQRVVVQEGTSTIQRFVVSPYEFLLPEITIEGERSALTVAEGISRGLYIRATPTDHNQYFLEGTRIYNPQHYGGVMSSFNADALRDVQVVASGVPPFYGGRIGGILDVSLRSGNSEAVSGTATAGTLASNFSLDGPIADHTNFILSGRRSYPNVFLSSQNEHVPSDLRSVEVMMKVLHAPSGHGRVSLTGYIGRDTYHRTLPGSGSREFANDLRWGNAAAHVRWIGVLSPSLFAHASAAFTRYGFDVEQQLSSPSASEPFVSSYAIEDASLRAHAEYFYDEQHTMRGGVELVHHRLRGSISEFSSQLAPLSLDGFSPWELSVYLQDQWRLVPAVTAELGARGTSFIVRGATFSALDPRFSLLFALDDNTRLYSSFSSVTQFIHPYRNSGIFVFTPAIFFYPSSQIVLPPTSLLLSLGFVKNTEDQQYAFALETYYRLTQRLHEFVFDTTRSVRGEITDAMLFGEGTAYGGELTITKRTGAVTGMLRYSLSLARNRFGEFGGGQAYTPRLNRTHELYLSLSYVPKEDWMLGVLCLLSTNQTPSLETSPAQDVPAPTNVRTTTEITAAEFTRYADHIDLNGARLPGFQRLELRLGRRFALWGVPVHASLRFVNGYGVVDPFMWELRDSPDNRLRWRATLKAPDLFPLYPVLSVGVRF